MVIYYDKVVEALEKERKFLLSRGQLGAENVLVHHALNVIDALPAVSQPEIVLCKDCKYRFTDGDNVKYNLCLLNHAKAQADDFFCADGE